MEMNVEDIRKDFEESHKDLNYKILDIEINITRRNSNIESIIGYNTNQEIIKIPNEIINQVKNDIQKSL
jgi:hypothetical protein